MASKPNPDVTLACVDPALLQCWEEKVRQGTECTLLLKHRKGKITTILTSTSTRILEPKVSPSTHKESSNQADKKKTVRKKGNSKKRVETLLSFQRHLVEEKGLPPIRLMLQHDAASPAQSFQAESNNIEHFKCDHC